MSVAAQAAIRIGELKVEGLRSPLGIDTATPRFSWQLESDQRGCRQTSYELTVSRTDGTVVWQSGMVESAQQTGIQYGGTALTSRTAYVWSVTVTDADGTKATASSTFETAFLTPEEWTAQWIHAGSVKHQTLQPLEVKFDQAQTCRYLRLNVTELGLRASTDAGFSFVQLSEVEVYAGDANVARTASLSVGKAADN